MAGHASKRMSHVQLAGIAELTQRSRHILPFLLRHNIDTPLAEYVTKMQNEYMLWERSSIREATPSCNGSIC